MAGNQQNASALLRRLERLKDTYGGEAAARKLTLLRRLKRLRSARAREVERFHEVLCFLRAFPDSPKVLAAVNQSLRTFENRADLRRFRQALADTGIAGTNINYPFYWFTALWLAQRWPQQLSVTWDDFDEADELEELLHLLVTYAETLALDESAFSLQEWVRRLKGPRETDAAFLIRRFEALPTDSFGRETFYEKLDIPVRLAPGADTPSRTHARYPAAPVFFQSRPLRRERPDLRREAVYPPLAMRVVSPREGQKLIDLAREAMVTRSRDLDVFEHGDPGDVRLVDCGEGLQFVCVGAVPERRLVLESVYGFLTLKNGVPIGYVLASALFRSSEVMYNVFETFRGAESAHIYGRVLAMVRHLLGSDTFSVDPYQLGDENEEGLESGAFWFYYKLGFCSHHAGVKRVLRRELTRMRRNPQHRSSIATLRKLVVDYVFFYLGRPRRDVIGRVSLGNIGLRISRYLAGRFGAGREAGLQVCSREAARLLALRSFRGWSVGERLWWERWSPLVLALPGVQRWSAAEKRALARVIRAKGSRRESDYVRLFNRHPRLWRSLLKLAD